MESLKALVLLVYTMVCLEMSWGKDNSGCIERSLVGENRLIIPNSAYTASSFLYDKNEDIPWYRRYVPHNARLNSEFGWSPRDNDNPEDYLQLDLGAVRAITAVATQGNGKSTLNEWIKTFKLRFKQDTGSTKWIEYGDILQNCYMCYKYYYNPRWACWCTYKDKKYKTMTANTVVRHDLKTIQEARYIRFLPVEFFGGDKTMRVNVFFINQEAPRVNATPSERSIFLQWTIQPCRKLHQLFTGYLLDVTTKGEFEVGLRNTSKYITGLQPYTEYKIRVKTVPYGLWSDNKTIQTDIAVPQVIKSVVTLQTLSSNSISVKWKHPQNHSINGPLTGYRVTYTTNKGQTKNVDIGVVNTWNITSLEKCTWYSVTVSVNNSKYIGPPSKNATIRIGNAMMAGPTNVSAIPTNSSSIAVSWSPVTMDNLTCDITGYDVKLTQYECADIKNGDWIIESTNRRSTIFTGLLPSTMYSVSVRAIAIAGAGPYSKRICVSTTQRNIQGCIERSLVGENRLIIPNSAYTASSFLYDKHPDIPDNRRYVPHAAKLYGPFGWSPRGNDNPEDYLQLDLGAVRAITAVATQGNGNSRSNEWIKTFKLRFKQDTTKWDEYGDILQNCYMCWWHNWGCWCTDKEKTKKTMTADTVVRHNLKTIQEARYIRFLPVEFFGGDKTIRVNVFFINQKAPRVNTTPSERSIFLQWTIQPCFKLTQLITGYLVDVSTKEGSKSVRVGPLATSKIITGLQPYTEYKIRVKAVPYGLWSDNKSIQTDIAVPQVIQSVVTLKTLSSNSISVTWKHPQNHSINGPLKGYRVTYTTNKGQSKNVDVGVVNTWNLTSLEKCTWYSVTVSVNNSKYIGPPSKNSTIRIGNAPMAGPTNVSAIPTNSSSIAVSWGPVTMDNLTCDITGYDVKLTQHECADIKSGDWIIESTSRRSTIFSGLSPSTMYSVSVRAITIAGPGPYSKPICVSTTQRHVRVSAGNLGKEGSISSSAKTVMIGLVVSLVVVIILLAVLTVLTWKRRRRRSNKRGIPITKSSNQPMTLASLTAREDPSSFSGGEETASSSEREKGCGSDILQDEVENPTRSELNPILFGLKCFKPDGTIDLCYLKEEFKSVPPKLSQYQCIEAEKPSNMKKNRYKNIFTYDRTRVFLKPESTDSDYINTARLQNDQNGSDSDYINASFVQGYDGSPNTYIATQGPLPDTTNDFWRMIWDQNTATIVMLTNVIELGKRKCHQYWPESSQQYGNITVNIIKVEVFADCVIRSFSLYKKNEANLDVRQFHFTAWPDKGVPQHASAILAFRRKVRMHIADDAGPIVVHCSAGVGRTGAYVMIDAMLQQAREQSSLDIYNYLQTIRANRPYMVQTDDQYKFVYLVVYKALACGNTEIQVENLNIAVRNLSKIDNSTNQSFFMQEFQRLNAVTSTAGSPMDDHRRVKLNNKEKTGEYINATYVDTYRERDAYIVTQSPTCKTVEEFWRLVMDHGVGTIVMLSKLQENNQSFHQYWPNEKEMMTCDNIKVKQIKVEYLDEVTVRTFQVINSTKSVDVVHLQHTDWKDKRTPSSPQSILNLLNEVQKSQHRFAGQSPVLVHCSNGVGRSGTFCSIASTLERVKQEQVLDVFQTVKSVRESRRGAVETFDQYKLCYTIVQNYLQSFSNYDNFKGK